MTGSRDAVGFVLRLGGALRVYGIPAHRLEEVLFGRQDERGVFLTRVMRNRNAGDQALRPPIQFQ
ncbi:MAG TPA: hypothetical protein VIM99_04195 [Blastocatellia bacterium]